MQGPFFIRRKKDQILRSGKAYYNKQVLFTIPGWQIIYSVTNTVCLILKLNRIFVHSFNINDDFNNNGIFNRFTLLCGKYDEVLSVSPRRNLVYNISSLFYLRDLHVPKFTGPASAQLERKLSWHGPANAKINENRLDTISPGNTRLSLTYN